jgi:hypothetical protein
MSRHEWTPKFKEADMLLKPSEPFLPISEDRLERALNALRLLDELLKFSGEPITHKNSFGVTNPVEWNAAFAAARAVLAAEHSETPTGAEPVAAATLKGEPPQALTHPDTLSEGCGEGVTGTSEPARRARQRDLYRVDRAGNRLPRTTIPGLSTGEGG